MNISGVKRYCCEDIGLIENYQKAVNDNTQMWDCHHRNEISLGKTPKELIELGLYYNRPASELIFLTHADHTALHHKDKVVSDESKKKMSDSHIGKEPGNKGVKGCTAGSKNGKYIWVCPLKLAYLYNIERLSMDELAKAIGVKNYKTINRKRKEYNIPIRKKEPWNKKQH